MSVNGRTSPVFLTFTGSEGVRTNSMRQFSLLTFFQA